MQAPDIALAWRVAESMRERDSASRALGMEILAMAAGEASVSMRIRDDMLNGHGSCHGGMIFSLADSAFAFACNSRNEVTVAAGCSIEFLSPGWPGQTLTAVAREQARSGRQGVYDVRVCNDNDEVVAVFRGKSTRIRGEVVPEKE